MAFTHGKFGAFAIGGTAGTSSPLTGFLDTVTLAVKEDMAESSTLGNTAKTYVQGLSDATIALGGKWDSGTAATGMDAVVFGLIGSGSVTPFVFGPAGTATGSVKKSGSFLATDYSVVGPIGGVVTWTANGQVSGPVSNGTF